MCPWDRRELTAAVVHLVLAGEGCQVSHKEQVVKKLNGAGLGLIPELGPFWVVLKGALVVVEARAEAAIRRLHRHLSLLSLFRREGVWCLLVLLRLGRIYQWAFD